MRHLILVAGAVALGFGQPALALELEDDRVLVLACLEQMESNATTWNQCLNLMFQPCVGEEVGSDGHVACLTTERVAWGKVAEDLRQEVSTAITAKGSKELAEILGSWAGFIVGNCAEVGAAKSTTGSESARLGCEVSEFVGLSGELAACLEGRSAAEFCEFKE